MLGIVNLTRFETLPATDYILPIKQLIQLHTNCILKLRHEIVVLLQKHSFIAGLSYNRETYSPSCFKVSTWCALQHIIDEPYVWTEDCRQPFSVKTGVTNWQNWPLRNTKLNINQFSGNHIFRYYYYYCYCYYDLFIVIVDEDLYQESGNPLRYTIYIF
jgi:hypothetical protein